jgi:hypothetical protein
MWQRLNFLGRRTVTAVTAVIANRHLSFARGVWKLARWRLAAVGEVTHQVPGRGPGGGGPRAGARAAAGGPPVLCDRQASTHGLSRTSKELCQAMKHGRRAPRYGPILRGIIRKQYAFGKEVAECCSDQSRSVGERARESPRYFTSSLSGCLSSTASRSPFITIRW